MKTELYIPGLITYNCKQQNRMFFRGKPFTEENHSYLQSSLLITQRGVKDKYRRLQRNMQSILRFTYFFKLHKEENTVYHLIHFTTLIAGFKLELRFTKISENATCLVQNQTKL